MKKLPDRPDARPLRTQAKELKRALTAGDAEARQRVLEFHPKFAGRPAERMEGWTFTLRDAQATVAREYGFDSWKALVEETPGVEHPRWGDVDSTIVVGRAFEAARTAGNRWVGHDHVLLALLNPPEPTHAADVLAEMGVTHEEVLARLTETSPAEGSDRDSARPNPTFHKVIGVARGLAIGMGSESLDDEHLLLALVYGERDGELMTTHLDGDDVFDGLRGRGVPVPSLAPPVASTPIGPLGSWVYFPTDEFPAVTRALVELYPPRSVLWGTNRSKWKAGYWYVQGEDEIPMEEIVRGVVTDPSTVDVLSSEDGHRRENVEAPDTVGES